MQKYGSGFDTCKQVLTPVKFESNADIFPEGRQSLIHKTFVGSNREKGATNDLCAKWRSGEP